MERISMGGDSRAENRLGMSFSITRGRLLVYHATIRELGEPGYIRFLYNDGKRRVAVQCCEKIDEEGFRVPKAYQGERFQFEINSSPWLSVIYKKCGWDIEQSYSVTGVSYPEHRLVEFRLDNAKKIAPAQFVDPENLDAMSADISAV